LSDNQFKGEELKKLVIYKENLKILKVGNNKIASFDDLDCLKEFEELIKVDFESNPLCGDNAEQYR